MAQNPAILYWYLVWKADIARTQKKELQQK